MKLHELWLRLYDEIKVNEKEIDITAETGSTVEDTNNLFGGTDI